MFSFKLPKIFQMRSIFSLLVVNLLTPCAFASDPVNSNPKPSMSPGRWALVVGVGTFSNPSLPKLRYAKKDAADFSDYLVNRNKFPADHVRLLQDESATKKNILNATTNWLPSVVKPDDLVIIYFSTYSPRKKADADRTFLMPSDGDKQQLSATGIDIKNVLVGLSSHLRTKKILCILETCYCDASDLASSGAVVITSSGPRELSWESKRHSNGVFTRSLLNALRGPGSDTAASAFAKISQNVNNEIQEDEATTQHPQLAGDESLINVLFDSGLRNTVQGDKSDGTGAKVELERGSFKTDTVISPSVPIQDK